MTNTTAALPLAYVLCANVGNFCYTAAVQNIFSHQIPIWVFFYTFLEILLLFVIFVKILEGPKKIYI